MKTSNKNVRYTMATDAYHAEFMRVWNDKRHASLTEAVRDYLQGELGARDCLPEVREHFNPPMLAERRRIMVGEIMTEYPNAVDGVLLVCTHVVESFLCGGDFYNAFLDEMAAYIVNTQCRQLNVKWVYDPRWTVLGNPNFTSERLFEINSDPNITVVINQQPIAEQQPEANPSTRLH